MRFSHKYRTLGSGSIYDWHAGSEMSTHEEETTVEIEVDASEGNSGASTGFSPGMIEQRIKANLEPLHTQISSWQKGWIP